LKFNDFKNTPEIYSPSSLGNKYNIKLKIPERGFLVAKFGVLLYIWGTKDGDVYL
jgi:hypothetical protein